MGAKSEEEQSALLCVLREFFVLDEQGAWTQGRCDEEIQRFKDKQRKAKASAAASWESRRALPPQSERIADAKPTHSKGNAPSLQSPVSRPIPKEQEIADQSLRSDPPTPPPAFDGQNAKVLNGKSVVALSTTWDLPDEWGVDAESLGWRRAEVLIEAEKFRQYWTVGRGQGTRRAVKGWRQSWSTWLGKAAERKQR